MHIDPLISVHKPTQQHATWCSKNDRITDQGQREIDTMTHKRKQSKVKAVCYKLQFINQDISMKIEKKNRILRFSAYALAIFIEY